MQQSASADIAIFGGGIAGLWLLNRLRQSGLTAILFETAALGGGQTNKSQGIIHGGMKYALQAQLTDDARAMADMPALWQASLEGHGEIDLSGVPVLSRQHYMWAPNKLTSKLAGFFAGAALKTKVSSLNRANYPGVFQHASFKGEVFAMDELVLDVPALLKELVKKNKDVIFKIDPLNGDAIKLNAQNEVEEIVVSLSEKTVAVKAQHFIFTAGAGNELVCKKLNIPSLAMQRRPLHMVLVKLPFDGDLYGHCLGLGARPRLTITTHHRHNGEKVWYLGGLLAEEGIRRDSQSQIREARKELNALFPWLDFSQAEFASFMVDRAEAKQQNGMKPESTFSKTLNNLTLAWPTKLALAPKLAADIASQLQSLSITSKWFDVHALHDWPMPPFANPVWEDAFCASDA